MANQIIQQISDYLVTNFHQCGYVTQNVYYCRGTDAGCTGGRVYGGFIHDPQPDPPSLEGSNLKEFSTDSDSEPVEVAPEPENSFFTDDSNICEAARYLGIISGGEPGFANVSCHPGRSYYPRGYFNGIQTYAYLKPWKRSIQLSYGEPPENSAMTQNVSCYPLTNHIYYCCGVDLKKPYSCKNHDSIWGKNPFTSDSHMCTAARFAGAIGSEGGVFHFNEIEDSELPTSFGPGNQNGIVTRGYGKYPSAFIIDSGESHSSSLSCGFSKPGLWHCMGTPNCMAFGTVYGSHIYHPDSNICLAARHSGLLDSFGGYCKILKLNFNVSSDSDSSITEQDMWTSYTFQGSCGNDIESKTKTSSAYLTTIPFIILPPSAKCGSIFSNSFYDVRYCIGSHLGCTKNYPVWGGEKADSGYRTYTRDSHPCLSAAHSGVIDRKSGGIFICLNSGSKSSFKASLANSIQTQAYGPWPTSMTILSVLEFLSQSETGDIITSAEITATETSFTD